MKNQLAKASDDLRITSDCVSLRQLVERDAVALYDAVMESQQQLGEWLDWCSSDYNLADALNWIQRTRMPAVWEYCQSFGVFAAGSSPFLLGCVGLSNIDYKTSCANLGYWIRTSQCGFGFAQKAALAMANYAITTLDLSRVEIAVHPLNERSARVASAIGATYEGVRPARILYRGTLVDARVYSISKSG
ncbi:GNAT family N-acetyltransferase [Xanthomonas campestris pv. fici]|nr:GNAT family protein [Xanthomonas oryzae]QEO96953.1 ribosomal-protein-serine acetyltransferase [Xanthomonas oryzae pv. oryzicola]WGY42412.1 GNAT family N-acetyltransferase [Xanthomonas oryzae pv. oryzicola]